MTAPHAEQLIDGYLARRSDAAAALPRGSRTELIDDMRAHIAEARARQSGDETDASVLNILDRLGEPNVVVADARDRLGIPPQLPIWPAIRDVAAIFLLPFFWPLGVILLWVSPAWNWRDKIIGSLLPPGGYLALILIGLRPAYGEGCGGFTDAAGVMHTTCTGGPPGWVRVFGPFISLALAILPLLTLWYLTVRLRQARQAVRRPA